jgi:hypothetical protein
MLEIDIAGGKFYHDFEAAQHYRRETVTYIRHAMGFDRVHESGLTRDPIIRSFGKIADGLQKAPERKLYS